eukprot:g3120.t1
MSPPGLPQVAPPPSKLLHPEEAKPPPPGPPDGGGERYANDLPTREPPAPEPERRNYKAPPGPEQGYARPPQMKSPPHQTPWQPQPAPRYKSPPEPVWEPGQSQRGRSERAARGVLQQAIFTRTVQNRSLLRSEELSLAFKPWPLAMAVVGAMWQQGIEVPQLALDSQRSPLGPELVQSLRRGVQWEQALWLARGWPRGTTETWFAAAGNCAIARAWQQAFYGLGRLRHHGLQLSTDALRQAFVLQRPLNPWKGSLKLLRMIRTAGFSGLFSVGFELPRRAFLRPSIIEFNKIFLSCARFSWSYTLYFLSLQRTEACEVDDASLSTALSAFCLKFRPWQYELSSDGGVFDEKDGAMRLMLRSFQANARCSNLGLRTLNSALGVFAKRPLLWKKAMQMAMAFERSPYVPDAPARQAIRVARARRTAAFRRLCRITASWQEAISTLERLRSKSLPVTVAELQEAVTACSDSSQWEMALQVSQELAAMVKGPFPGSKFQPRHTATFLLFRPMQGLGRLAHSDDSPGPPASGSALLENSMYQPVPTSEYFDGMPSDEPRCWSTRGGLFNLVVGLVVCANAVLMAVEADLGLLGPTGPTWSGLETDLDSAHAVRKIQHGLESEINLQEKLNATLHKSIAFNSELSLPAGAGPLRFAAYTVCEYFFVLFFLCEMLLRLCDLGCRRYLCRYAWMPLDAAVVLTGLMDLSLPFFLDAEVERMSVLPFLRLLRVLRLLKLFQVCHPLRIIGRGVLKAFSVVILVGLVVLVLNFGLAIILTTLIGQRSALAETNSASQEHIATVLGNIYPSGIVVPMIVLYMMICCFAVVGLITSVISDSFVTAQQRDQKAREAAKDMKRGTASMELGRHFIDYGRTIPGFINRKELEAALQEPFVSQVLNSMEAIACHFFTLCEEASFANRVQEGHMAEAVTSLGGGWRVSGFFDVKHQVMGVKNDVVLKAELAAKDGSFRCEAADQRRELQELDRKTKSLQTEVSKEMSSLKNELSSVKAQISKVLVKMEEQANWLEQEKKERSASIAEIHEKINILPAHGTALAGITSKVELIESQVVAQSSLQGKIDPWRVG